MENQDQNPQVPKQDEQSTNQATPNIPTLGSHEKVLQPSAELVEEMKAAQNNNISKPTEPLQASLPTDNIDSATNHTTHPATYPDPGTLTNASVEAEQQISKKKKVKKIFLFAGLIALVVIFVVAGYFVTKHVNKSKGPTTIKTTPSNTNVQSANIHGLSQQTFTNSKGDTYSILFYNNSTVQSYNYGTGNTNVLVSPTIVEGGVPVFIGLAGKPNDSTPALQNDIQNITNCSTSPGSTEAFTVSIKSLNVTANFCTVAEGLGYWSYFGNNQSVYYMLILPESNKIAPTAANEQYIINSNPSTADAKAIAASFQYLYSK